MKNCRAKHGGNFSCELNEATLTLRGTENVLVLKGKRNSERLIVPDDMLSEARQVMKRSGDDVLAFAELCITYAVALKAWRKRSTKKKRKPKASKKALEAA